MNKMDNFSEYYSDILDGQYGCMDRIVVNRYFPFDYNSGRFCT